MRRLLKSAGRFYAKYIYFTILIIILPFIFADLKFNAFSAFYNLSNAFSSLASISATFIGFLLTSLTIFFSAPKDSRFMKRLIQTGHHKIFAKTIILGITFYFVTIILWLIEKNTLRWDMYFFIGGSLEVIVTFYYLYYLITNNMDNFR